MDWLKPVVVKVHTEEITQLSVIQHICIKCKTKYPKMLAQKIAPDFWVMSSGKKSRHCLDDMTLISEHKLQCCNTDAHEILLQDSCNLCLFNKASNNPSRDVFQIQLSSSQSFLCLPVC